MLSATTMQTVCRHFAALLGYPDGTTRSGAASCAGLLGDACAAASPSFAGFSRFLETHEDARIEEIYTATFDLQPACHPYVGYQLCGESQQRALFLMQLQQLYRQHGFAGGSELPDHLATMLRFIAAVDDPCCRAELIRDGLLPALDKMLAQTQTGTQPYAQLLQSLQLFLRHSVAAPVLSAVSRQKEVCS